MYCLNVNYSGGKTLVLFYHGMCLTIFGKKSHPVYLVDLTKIDGEIWVGRSTPLSHFRCGDSVDRRIGITETFDVEVNEILCNWVDNPPRI